MNRPLRVLLLLAAAAVVALALLAAPGASETLTPDGLLSKLDKSDRVTLTTADGQEKEITVGEMERLAQEQHRRQAEMQREATASAGPGGTVEFKEDEETKPRRRTESLDEVRKSDPRFAANIELAKRSFAEIQRHGYARGYALTGFSEKDERAAQRRASDTKAAAAGAARADYQTSLLLRAKRDPGDSVARTGTSAQKREREPLTVAYEVQVLLDAQDQFSVLAAWELGANDARGVRLSVQASAAHRRAAQAKPKTGAEATAAAASALQWLAPRAGAQTWILAGGVALIGLGLVVLYASQRPAPAGPRARGRSADNWELATDAKAKTKQPRAGGSKKTN